MKFRLFQSQIEKDNAVIAKLDSTPNNTGHSDEELITKLTREAVQNTSAQPENNMVPTTTIDGTDKLTEILSPRLLEYIEISSKLSELLQIDTRDGYAKTGILEFMGLNREFATKYLQAIFGNIGRPTLSNPDETIQLVKSGPFIDTLYYDVMELDDSSSPSKIRLKIEQLSSVMARLRNIKQFKSDLELTEGLISKIEETESSSGRNPANKKLSYHEVRELAEEMLGRTKPLDQKDLKALTAELDAIIAENLARVNTTTTSTGNSGASVKHPAPTSKQVLNYSTLLSNASPELSSAITRLNGLYEIFRGTDEDKKITIELAINDTRVAIGNLLGTIFNNVGYPDVLRLVADTFKLTTNKQLADKLLEIDAEFQAKDIYQIH